MNFIKGIVDGILATDSDGTNKSKQQYDPDEPEYDSDGYERTDGSKYRIHSNENIHITSSVSHLSELYKSERDNCLNSLIIRYGEGYVQQLSELLKSNHETILTLSRQLQNNLSSLKEVTDKVESAAIEHIKLKNENNNLVQRLQQLSSENVSLKSQLTQADIAIKSNERHISSLNELLKDNKSTFENMKDRCAEFYNLKYEIEELKKKLSLSESHVLMLKKERDEYWLDPNCVLKDEYKKRILQALEREDRSIEVAKIMASQTASLTKPPKVKVVDAKMNEVDDHLVSELTVRVEKLEYENAHLKEINDSLHTMYADLSKNMNEVKNTYLRESIDSLASYFPPKTRPVQLVFVQPTGVLDLEFNPDSLPSYFESTHPMDLASASSESYQQKTQPFQDSSDSFKSSQTQDSSPAMPGFSSDSTAAKMGFREPSQPTFKPSHEYSEPQRAKKSSPKMSFRSKVINYVTKLDSSINQQSKADQTKLVDLDSPQPTIPTVHHHQNTAQHPPDVFEPQPETSVEPDKLKTWNSDWDFFDDPSSDPSAQPLTVSHTPTETGIRAEFDLILDEQSEQSQNRHLHGTVKEGRSPSGESANPAGTLGTLQSEPRLDESLLHTVSSTSNYPESLSDDPFDAIIMEQESESTTQLAEHQLPTSGTHNGLDKGGASKVHLTENVQIPQRSSTGPVTQHPQQAKHSEQPAAAELLEQHQETTGARIKKGWDDIDFDDEMFQ